MLTLLAKDFRLLLPKSRRKEDLLSAFLYVLVFALFLFVEVLIYVAILTKIKRVEGASMGFTSLFLFVLSVVSLITALFRAERLFFDEKDVRLLSTLPVKEGQVVTSKLLLLLLSTTFESFLFSEPIFISYGILATRQALFYFVTLFYPILLYFFQAGVLLLLLLPFHYLVRFFQNRPLLELLVLLPLSYGLAFGYGHLLVTFVTSVASSGGSVLFETETLTTLTRMSHYLYVAGPLTRLFLLREGFSFVPYLFVTLGTLLLGFSLFLPLYPKVRLLGEPSLSYREKLKARKPLGALIRKEILLSLRKEGRGSRFLLLLLVEPYLLLLIESGVRILFQNGVLGYYKLVLPELDLAFYLYFFVVYSMVAAENTQGFLSVESSSPRTLKILPISRDVQLQVKLLVPYLPLVLASFLSCLLLGGLKVVSYPDAIFFFVLSLLVSGVEEVLLLNEEMKARSEGGHPFSCSSFYGFLIPVFSSVLLCLFVSAHLSKGLSEFLVFAVLALISFPALFFPIRSRKKTFDDMEVFRA